ncbi:RDD family protein [Phycisphaerae bacterium RAS2]|nr:RDD family protein [Phycisphaerae bacterium RAS2]
MADPPNNPAMTRSLDKTRRRCSLFLALACGAAWCGVGTTVAQEPWKGTRVWVAGGDESAWVVAEGRVQGEKLPTIQMWHAGAAAAADARPVQNSFLQPVVGNVLHASADARALRVMFSDLTTGDYYINRAWSPGASWKEQSTISPLAWGADATEPAVYAAIRGEDLLTPTTAPAGDAEDDDEMQPSTELPAAEQVAVDGMAVLELRRGRWRRMQGPDEAAAARRVWIAGCGGRIHLYWRDGKQLLHSERVRNQWSKPVAVVEASDFLQAWGGATAEGPALIIARGDSGERASLNLFMRRESDWMDAGPLRAGEDVLHVDVERCSAAIVRKQVGVARVRPDGVVEFGLGELGQTPLMRFAPLALVSGNPALEQQWRDSLVMAGLLAFLTIVMWWRRADVALPVILPPGFVLAAVWRRVFATVFDLLPAYLITLPWIYPKLDPQMLQMYPNVTNEQLAEMWAAIRIEQYVAIGLYGLWCLIFEATIATTPGKAIFGCRVAAADGGRPSLGACVVRNAVRSLMVAMGVPGLMITLMTIVIVSRNRQRVGDLLARTVVIEPAPPAIEAPPTDESDQE